MALAWFLTAARGRAAAASNYERVKPTWRLAPLFRHPCSPNLPPLQLVTAAKVDKVVSLALEALQAGHCPVIGLQVRGPSVPAAAAAAAACCTAAAAPREGSAVRTRWRAEAGGAQTHTRHP